MDIAGQFTAAVESLHATLDLAERKLNILAANPCVLKRAQILSDMFFKSIVQKAVVQAKNVDYAKQLDQLEQVFSFINLVSFWHSVNKQDMLWLINSEL